MYELLSSYYWYWYQYCSIMLRKKRKTAYPKLAHQVVYPHSAAVVGAPK